MNKLYLILLFVSTYAYGSMQPNLAVQEQPVMHAASKSYNPYDVPAQALVQKIEALKSKGIALRSLSVTCDGECNQCLLMLHVLTYQELVSLCEQLQQVLEQQSSFKKSKFTSISTN